MYPEIMVIPMREELTRLGIEDLRTAEDVDHAIKNRSGTTMVVVNSICGCAAGRMRPAVRAAMQHSSRPEQLFTSSPGRTKKRRIGRAAISLGYPPSSPSIAILRDGKLVLMMPRSDIDIARRSTSPPN